LSGSGFSTTTFCNSLALIGNHLYCGGNAGLLDGLISGSTVSFSVITSTGLSPVQSDFGSCTFGANVSVASPDTVYHCTGGAADTLYASGAGPHTWAVMSGPAFISGSGDTVTVTSTANATLILSSAALAVCGSDSDTVTIIVPPADTIASNSPLCSGGNLQLSANGYAGTTYSWHGPNSFSDTMYNPAISNVPLNDSGFYTLTETFHNCVSTDSVHILIKPTPAMPIATSNSPLCANDTLQFTINNLQLSNTYQWHGPNGFSQTISDPAIDNIPLSDSGKYIVKASLNGCVSEPDTIDVRVNQLVTPTVTISSSPAIIPAGHVDTFTANTTDCNSPTYQWYRNGIAIAGATTNPYTDTLATGDHISVQVHCAPCASPDTVSSNMLTTTGVTSPRPAPYMERVTVWPNPVGEILNIEIVDQAANNGYAIKLFDVVGRIVCEGMMTSPGLSKGVVISTIDTHNFSKGTYLLEITDSNGNRVMKKIVK